MPNNLKQTTLYVLGAVLLFACIYFSGVTLREIFYTLLLIKIQYMFILLMITVIIFWALIKRWRIIISRFMDVGRFKKGFFILSYRSRNFVPKYHIRVRPFSSKNNFFENEQKRFHDGKFLFSSH